MPISPGVQFGMEGPVMTGTWINPKTGHKFTVRDTFFQDNQFMVQTTDGQMLDYNTIQNYIQCNDNSGKAIEPTPDIVEHRKEDIPKEVADMVVSEEDMNLGNIFVEPNDARFVSVSETFATTDPDPDMVMVERVLKRHQEPKIVSQISWDAPKKQIETLVDILGIDPQTIATYYIKKLDMKTIINDITKTFAEYISDMVEPAKVVSEVQDVPAAPQPKPKPKTKRTK